METLHNSEKQKLPNDLTKIKQCNCPKCNSKIPKRKSITEKYCQKSKSNGPKKSNQKFKKKEFQGDLS